jgi:signal transduction histidine kinase
MDKPSGQTLLIVDDNPAFADNLREILEDAGYKVRLAASCAAALSEGEGFCVALIDVRLPDGDGVALAAQLKAKLPDLEVILLTGSATLESAMAAVRAGASAYLIKPCSTENLLLMVRQAVRHVVLVQEKRHLARRTVVAEKLAAVGTLAAGLSHEIRNPLNAASLQLTLLERRVRRLEGEAHMHLLDPLSLVQQELERLSQLVEDFLQFARPREFIPMAVDLRAVADSVIDFLLPQAERAGLRLDSTLPAVPAVTGNTSQLRQAIMNLLLNAIHATPRGGSVHVTVGEHAGEIFLSVEDSGPGIPPALRPRIFEPFFTTKETGVGLGLPMVHSIAQQHGGDIFLTEGTLGGARFVMKLPPRPE